MATDDGTGLLDTPADWTDAGYGAGAAGETVVVMLCRVMRACGTLLPWQRAALLEGHRQGVLDLAEHLSDMANHADVPAVPAGELPF